MPFKHRPTSLKPLVLALHLALVGPLALPVAEAQAQAAATVQYDVPAGPLADALNRFATQSGVSIAVDRAKVQGLRTQGLKGAYRVEEGFDILLRGSGYIATKTSSGYALTEAPKTGRESVMPTVTVTAQLSETELPPVYTGGQVATGGRLGLLGNTNFMDTPFNQTSYTADLIQDQQARSLSDLLINDPSVRLATARTNINEDFAIRGFTVSSGDVALNGMYGLMPFFRVPVEMAERVEVLKGPSALLNGMPPSGNIGGSINVVPKRAEDDPLTRVTFGYVSDSIFGVHTDIGRRFGNHKEFGIRVNSAYRDGDTTIDEQDQTDQTYTLALDYRGRELRASLDVIHQKQDIGRVVRQFGFAPGLTDLPSAPDSDLNYPGYGYSDIDDKAIVGRVEYDVNEHMTVYGGIGRREHNMDALAGNPMLLNTAGDFSSVPSWQIYEVDTNSYELGTYINFSTGKVGHKLSLNYSEVDEHRDIDFDTFFAARLSNIYNPVYSDTPDTSAASVNPLKYQRSNLVSYALADTLSFYEDKIKLTLGVRRQHVEQQTFIFSADTNKYDQWETTPAVGIVFQPRQDLSFYASYIEALSRGDSDPDTLTSAPPFVSKQHEVGVKKDWGRFVTTLSLYQIERPTAASTGVDYAEDKQRNRGVELNIFGEVVRDVRLLGGLVYMDGELTDTVIAAHEGNDAVAVPQWQANIGVDWDNAFIPGFGLNARLVYTGEQYADSANVLQLPSWTRYDIGARYRTKLGGKPVVFRANIENLFDKDYWAVSPAAASANGFLYVGTPRTVLLSTTVDF